MIQTRKRSRSNLARLDVDSAVELPEDHSCSRYKSGHSGDYSDESEPKTVPERPSNSSSSREQHDSRKATSGMSSYSSPEMNTLASTVPRQLKPPSGSAQRLVPSVSWPTVTPVSSACSITRGRNRIRVERPSFSHFLGTQSESSFIDMIQRIDSSNNKEQPEKQNTNATFAFVQRSGKESLLVALNQIQELTSQSQHKDEEEAPSKCPSSLNQIQELTSHSQHINEEEARSKCPSSLNQIQELTSQSQHKNEEEAPSKKIPTSTKTISTAEENYSTRAGTVREHFVGLYSYAHDDYYRIILVRANAIQITADAMRTFSINELVQASGNMFLGKLCVTRQNGLKLVEAGGLHQVIGSIKNFPTSSNICSLAVNCLYKVTEVTDLAMLFLEKMHDAQEVISGIPESLLSFESLDNWKALTERFQRKPL
jgi:hypothetical protein